MSGDRRAGGARQRESYEPELRAAALVIALGAFSCFAGGGIGGSIGAWNTGSSEALLTLVQEHTTMWRLANWPWVFGIPLVGAGIAPLAVRLGRPLGILGLALWLLAATLGATHFAAREVAVSGADTWARTGVMPSAWPLVEGWADAVGIAFMVLAYLANLVIGAALVRSRWVAPIFGWSVIAGALILAPAIFAFIPAGAMLPALLVAGAAWKFPASP